MADHHRGGQPVNPESTYRCNCGFSCRLKYTWNEHKRKCTFDKEVNSCLT